MEDEKWVRTPMCDESPENAERIRNLLFVLLAAGLSELEPRLYKLSERD